jgi:hypothetical protein
MSSYIFFTLLPHAGNSAYHLDIRTHVHDGNRYPLEV